MDSNGRIYADLADRIPETDKSRLEGYLRGRAEADALAQVVAKQAELERLEAEQRDS